MKIAYVTDLHLDEQFPNDMGVDARSNWKTILSDVSKRNIDEIIFGGDIGEASANEWFFESLKNVKHSLSLGNHDSYKEVVKYYDSYSSDSVNELYHARSVGNYKFIYLDSSTEMISDEQFVWFKNELKTEKDIVLFIHHPVVTGATELDKRFSLKDSKMIREELLFLNQKATIFSGHYHFEDKRLCDNIVQYITPASSYQAEKTVGEIRLNNITFGYRIIELTENEINTEVISFSTTSEIVTKII